MVLWSTKTGAGDVKREGVVVRGGDCVELEIGRWCRRGMSWCILMERVLRGDVFYVPFHFEMDEDDMGEDDEGVE